MIRTAGDSGQSIPPVRRHVASLDRDVPVQSLRPFERWRFTTLLLGIFAALAMVLGGVRHREIAIRMAVGA
jgi:hypothetical protein